MYILKAGAVVRYGIVKFKAARIAVIVFCCLVMFWRKRRAGGLLYSRLSEMDTNKQNARLETTPAESAKTSRLALLLLWSSVSVLMQEIPIRPAVMSQNKNKTGLNTLLVAM